MRKEVKSFWRAIIYTHQLLLARAPHKNKRVAAIGCGWGMAQQRLCVCVTCIHFSMSPHAVASVLTHHASPGLFGAGRVAREKKRDPRSVIATRPSAASSSSFSVAASGIAPRDAVVILPGLGNCSEDYDDFASELESRGFSATVAKVIRPDWLRNAAGLTSLSYWQGTLEPRPTVDWYLSRIADAVKEAKERSGASKVTIVAHSAGGWMARVYLKDFGVDDVAAFVSLGSPLNAVPKDVPGVVDQTRGILTYVEANW